MVHLPLLRHVDSDAVFAYRGGAKVTVRAFLHDVTRLAGQLPDKAYVLNVCADRYRFCVGFVAALLRRQITLLPPNQTPDLLARLEESYAGVYRLSDATDTGDTQAPLATVMFPELPAVHGPAPAMPAIPANQTAALVFTSGSTGAPVPHRKTWGTLAASGTAEATRLGVVNSGMTVLGTVPPQHMYGLESTVMMPMLGALALHAARPFYPADICGALDALPRPRALVTTPVHLRALVSEAALCPALDLIVCATAPLAPQLAARAEARFQAPLYEIYGCTEAGQIATRRTVQTPEWQTLPGLVLRQDEKGTWVKGGHVEEEVLLNDIIELHGRNRFALHGRNADLVNIAGKRTSLAHLNHHLNSIEGVLDGVFIFPDDDVDGVSRLMAFVVAPGVTHGTVMKALRSRIDSAFLPRPLSFVASLPRNATGKLPRAAVAALRSVAGEIATRNG